MKLIEVVSKIPFLNIFFRNFETQKKRDAWIQEKLENLPAGHRLLDAGCGSQRYKKFCNHLEYRAQDFGEFQYEAKKTIVSDEYLNKIEGEKRDGYEYGVLDYISNIWNIPEKDGYFDAILCTEVFEHIPYPVETVKEFSRLIKPGGYLILTAPSSCLRHMDPYFFYSGFSDRWHEMILKENNFDIIKLEQVGDYYGWMCYEIAKTAITHSFFSKIFLLPSFLYYSLKTPTEASKNSMCFAYQIIARRSVK